jgi:hypothetical protein
MIIYDLHGCTLIYFVIKCSMDVSFFFLYLSLFSTGIATKAIRSGAALRHGSDYAKMMRLVELQ